MRQAVCIMLASAALLAGCGMNSGAPPPMRSDSRVWPASGKTMTAYIGAADYSWRSNALDWEPKINKAFSSYGLGKSDYDVLLGICTRAQAGNSDAELRHYAKTAASTSIKGAATLVSIATGKVCRD